MMFVSPFYVFKIIFTNIFSKFQILRFILRKDVESKFQQTFPIFKVFKYSVNTKNTIVVVPP